jgi:putative Mg2+ transporter-C (MgtC) family protein
VEIDIWQLTPWPDLDLGLRLLIAALLGGILGLEREQADKPAGLRTLILVCMGSALFTIASKFGFGDDADAARVAAGIVAGIGFLGAGTILRVKGEVIGITTAATIWAVAAVGLAVGAGLYLVALVTTGIALVALHFLAPPRRHDR